MEPVAWFILGMFIITVGGVAATVLATIRAVMMWDSFCDSAHDTILDLFRR